jgi:hypothetical protein
MILLWRLGRYRPTLGSSGRQVAVMSPADVALAVSAFGGSDSERPRRSEKAAFRKVLTQGSLDNCGERRPRLLSPDIAFHGLRKVIRNSHSGTFHRFEL